MSLLLKDRIYTMESPTANRGVYPMAGYKLGLYRIPIKLDDKVLEVQIADTKELRTRGLSWNSEKLPYNEGMLFVFDGSGTRSMWMLGMQFNLDIIWFDENANVVAIEKNVPLCETTIEVVACRENGVSGDNAKYVLEVTAGFVDKFNITENSKLEIISI